MINKYEIAECVIHYIDGKYECTEWYINESFNGGISYTRRLSNSEEYFNIKKYGDFSEHGHCEIYELHHNEGYEKIKSPYDNVLLYGRFINISSKLNDIDARF